LAAHSKARGAGTGSADRTNDELGWLAAHGSNEVVRRRSFEELFRRLWRASVEWSMSAGVRDRSLAEDAATQAWLRAWRYRTRYDRQRSPYGAWLSTIVRNESRDLLASESRRPMPASSEIDQIDLSDGTREPDIGLSFVSEAVAALRTAKPDFAAALWLKAEGYPDKQIGALLGVAKEGTVASRLFRAKRYVAEWLAEQGLVLISVDDLPTPRASRLKSECRTSVGVLYSCSPSDGLFVLPAHSPRPPSANLVCDGFMVRVWAYDLNAFRILTADEVVGDKGRPIVFRWQQYRVVERGEVEGFATPA
jgi:RNA polymerase sigma factor (sigma-70 family)